jgi:hypothetical protein
MKDKMRSMDEDGDDDDDGAGGGVGGDGYDNDDGNEDENDEEEEEEMEGDVIVDMGGLSFGAVRGTGENVATSDRWREELDAKGYTYYHDEVTGESVWVRPHVDVDDPYSSGLPSHEEYVDESGERCYHNVGTGVTLWAKDPKTNAYDPSQWVDYITSEGDKFHVNIVTEEHVSEVHSQIYRSESAKAQEQDMLGWHVEEGEAVVPLGGGGGDDDDGERGKKGKKSVKGAFKKAGKWAKRMFRGGKSSASKGGHSSAGAAANDHV